MWSCGFWWRDPADPLQPGREGALEIDAPPVSMPLISCRCCPLVEPVWKRAAKETVDVVHTDLLSVGSRVEKDLEGPQTTSKKNGIRII